MLLIIAHHYSVHGGWDNVTGLNVNKLYVQFLSMGGKLEVNLFVLITGFFMVNSTLKVKNILKLISQTWFYSIGILIITYSLNLVPISVKGIIKSFFPIVFSSYWFITAFIVLYLLIPYLNKFIKTLDKNEYKYLFIILSGLLVIIPTGMQIGNVGWFIFLYLIGGYIKKFPLIFSKNKYIYLSIFSISYILIFLTIIIFDYLGIKYNIFSANALFFIRQSSPFILICSISLFCFFKNLEIKNNKVINTISSTVFGIYLIHDNMFIRPFFWIKLYKNNSFYHSKILFFHSIITIVSVFMLCFFIDLIRKKIVKILNLENLLKDALNKISLKYKAKGLELFEVKNIT